MTDEFFGKLKNAVIKAGFDAISDLTGTDIDETWNDEAINDLIEETFDQMPDEELLAYYEKYAKGA